MEFCLFGLLELERLLFSAGAIKAVASVLSFLTLEGDEFVVSLKY